MAKKTKETSKGLDLSKVTAMDLLDPQSVPTPEPEPITDKEEKE